MIGDPTKFPPKSPLEFLPRIFPIPLFFLLNPGMLPHKTKRGQAALERLKVFDGIPPPYDKVGTPNPALESPNFPPDSPSRIPQIRPWNPPNPPKPQCR